MSRPSKYTPATVELLCRSIKVGATYELAAKAAGITYETFRVWRETKAAFSAAVEKAEGEAAVGWLAKIEQAANDGTWTAAAWKLERRYPQDYGRQVVDHRHSGAVSAAVTVQHDFDYDAYARLFTQLTHPGGAESATAPADGAPESLDPAHADAAAGVLPDGSPS